MPVEINELVIKAKISDTVSSTQNEGGNSGPTVNEAALEPVEKAVKEIMNILKRKNER